MKTIELKTWEIQAALEGRLGMLARPVAENGIDTVSFNEYTREWMWHTYQQGSMETGVMEPVFGKIGDVFAGLEEWRVDKYWDSKEPSGIIDISPIKVCYSSDVPTSNMGRCRTAEAMPHDLSRIRLTVKGVNVKRISELGLKTALKLGFGPGGFREIEYSVNKGIAIVDLLREQWNDGYPNHPWESNPHVWLAKVDV